MDGPNSWCLIESDPGVFTELIRGFGCVGVQVEELLTLDCLDDPVHLSEKLEPVHGLVFLYRWRPGDHTPSSGTVVLNSVDMGLFFAKQTINNACATQAILSVLLNCRHPDVELGETLTGFRDFVQAFNSVDKGLTLGESTKIKEIHNAFARTQMFAVDPVEAKEGDDVFHFVAYIPFMGRVYELDGLKEGPIDLGVNIEENQNWMIPVKAALMARVASFPIQEIRFNLMALITDRKMVCERKISELEEKRNAAALKMEIVLSGEMEEASDTALSSDPDVLQQIIENAEEQIEKLLAIILEEAEKKNKYHIENIRRKHNYLPVILELLKILGGKKVLLPLAEKAKEKALERRRANQTAGKSKGKVPASAGGDVMKK